MSGQDREDKTCFLTTRGNAGRGVDSIPNTGEPLLRILACIVVHVVHIPASMLLLSIYLLLVKHVLYSSLCKRMLHHLIFTAGTFPRISHWMKFRGKTTNRQCLWVRLDDRFDLRCTQGWAGEYDGDCWTGGQCTGSCAAAVSRLTGPSRELHCS